MIRENLKTLKARYQESKYKRLGWVSIVMVACLLLGAFAWMMRTIEVTVDLDGEEKLVQTRADTVEELLTELEVDVAPEDGVEPALDTPLEADMNVVWQQAIPVTVDLNGEETQLKTLSATVADLLDELEVDHTIDDDISPSLHIPIHPQMSVSWKQAIPIQVNLDGEEEQAMTTADTVEELLTELEVEHQSEDQIIPELEHKLEADMEVEWHKAIQVTLDLRGEEEEVWTTAKTVEEFLEEQEVELKDGDQVEHKMGAALRELESVVVTHFHEEIEEETHPIAYETIRKDDPSLTKGEERVTTAGKEGEEVHQYKVTYENGEKISREKVDTQVVENKEDRVIAVGTKERQVSTASSSNSNSSGSSGSSGSGGGSSGSSSSSSDSGSSGSTSTFQATAYSANCNGCSGFTATGVDVRNQTPNIIAVDPNVIPLGSEVELIVGGSSWGTYTAQDTGGHIQGNRIDILMSSQSEARSFGRKSVQVRQLE